MDSATKNRVLVALDLMARKGWGIEKAAKFAKTTRRTVKRYAVANNIDLTFEKGKSVKLKRTPDEKVEDFLTEIHSGSSATAAARKLKTTVPTMAKREIKGVPIRSKVGNRWEINFIPVKEYSIVYHGDLVGFNDSVQGRGQLSGPDANKPKNKKKQDEEYADIWYQIDVEGVKSTLPIEEVAKAYEQVVIEAAKKKLESLGLKNAGLMKRFSRNSAVLSDMTANKRDGTEKVSVLENMTQRYDMKLGEPKNGIDEDFNFAGKVQFIPVKKFRGVKKESLDTKFQLFYLRKGDQKTYGPVKITVRYTLE